MAPQPAMAIKNAINIMNAAFISNPPTEEWVAGEYYEELQPMGLRQPVLS
jgi:hypothetical protein